MHGRVRTGKQLCGNVLLEIGLKQGDALSPLLFNYAIVYAIKKVHRNPAVAQTEWDTSASGLC
jgi:hypothetical protein